MDLHAKLTETENALRELESTLADPGVLSDPKRLREVNERYVDMKKIVEAGRAYAQTDQGLKDAQALLSDEDPELREVAQAEAEKLSAALPELTNAFLAALLPPDPIDRKNAIIEIRAGSGGDESAMFAADLLRMYTRFAERRKWKTSLISSNQNELGGFKEVIVNVKGAGAYGTLKYEAGVHRVQRVPETEKQGRVHTSTATVAILPELEQVDFQINPEDLKIESSTASGHGGQSVNTTYSAIRMVHIPTGIEVRCSDERSQAQNKEKALEVMRGRVYALEQERKRKELSEARKSQIGSGDRSEKIRTYNMPQDRLTDHRIKTNWHNLPGIMDGDLSDVFMALQAADTTERLDRE